MKDIPFTFGIITYADDGVNEHLPNVVDSIRLLKIPTYEILIVGNKDKINSHIKTNEKRHKDIRIINFDEKIKPKWITKKKNLITAHARFNNIVYQHDYIKYNPDWYEGYKKFGIGFEICMNKIVNFDGTRYRDWVVFPYHHAFPCPQAKRLWEYVGIKNNRSLIPYNETRFTKWQYISGAFWVCKKHVMQEFPLDENLVWGQAEDCKWSFQVKKKYNFKMNPHSTVHLLKKHNPAFSPIVPECYEKMKEYWHKIQSGQLRE